MNKDFTTTVNDTICAISTAPGKGGIAVVRISGPDATAMADRIWSGKHALSALQAYRATYGRIVDPDIPGEPIDDAVATVFRSPHSFTGEDTVEIAVHGSLYIQREVVNLLIRQGCRLAEPGEFTRRAFASGKIDLAQAEAVADVIASTSRGAHRLAVSQMRGRFSGELAAMRDRLLELASLLELELDFSEEDVEFADRAKLLQLAQDIKKRVDSLAATFACGDAIKNGVPVAIVGAPNVGKSSILNRLLGDDRALVSDIPGTTRDTVEDTTDIDGITFRFIDTAGIRATDDPIESLGIERSYANVARARIILWVVTPDDLDTESLAEMAHDLREKKNDWGKVVLVVNKRDLAPHVALPDAVSLPETADAAVAVSALCEQGLDELRHELSRLATADMDNAESDTIVTNARHYEALRLASASLARVIASLFPDPANPYPLSGDFIAQDVRETLHHLGSITGTISTPEILATIFSRFCIGK